MRISGKKLGLLCVAGIAFGFTMTQVAWATDSKVDPKVSETKKPEQVGVKPPEGVALKKTGSGVVTGSAGVEEISPEKAKKKGESSNAKKTTAGDVGAKKTGGVGSYIIGSGDLLSITVFGEEDLSLKKVRVESDGTVSFPLLGKIMLKGFTSENLEEILTARLQDGYLKQPKVTVSIMEYRMFYVNGEVKKPGGYKFVNGLTIEKAIALAGGFTERASRSKISLAREIEPEKPIKSVHLTEKVMPGDVVTVGESYF